MTIKTHPSLRNFFEASHPILTHKLSLLRSKYSDTKLFRELMEEITILLGYEATQNLQLVTRLIETPITTIETLCFKDQTFIIMPILRAGLGMVGGMLKLFPAATVAYASIARNEKTLEAVCHYFKPPSCDYNKKNAICFICDPMLATGGTACLAIQKLKEWGVVNISLLCIVAAPEGVKRINLQHSDVKIYSANLDDKLNKDGYIVPGLGDAGDRLWG